MICDPASTAATIACDRVKTSLWAFASVTRVLRMPTAGATPGASGDIPAASAATAVPCPSSGPVPAAVPKPMSRYRSRPCPNVLSGATPLSSTAMVTPRPHWL